MTGSASSERIAIAELEALVVAAFERSNVAPAVARSVAAALVAAEIDGQGGHGLGRVASYAAQARSGKVDGHATATCGQTRTAALVVDAAHGFAFPAFDLAIEALPQATATTGIAAAAITRSHHCGQLGRHVERLADAGLVALLFANTPKAMAAPGGTRAVFGTNPIGFALPRRDAPPVVVDLALSEVARGKIVMAAKTGTPIPLGWAYDAGGQPTTDARAALDGSLAAMGGAKGAALAFMVEVLAAAVTGSHLASEASSFLDTTGGPPNVGQLLIAIDPAAFAGRDVMLDRMAVLAADIEGDGAARLPGSRRHAMRVTAERDGLAVTVGQLAELRALAAG